MIELRIYRKDRLVRTDRYEDAEEAQAAAEWWTEEDEVTCEIDDLSVHHAPDEILGGDVDLEPGEDAVGGEPPEPPSPPPAEHYRVL